MRLYDIPDAMEECVDAETGEIIDFDRLTELQMERDKKIENIACWIKDLVAEAKSIKEERIVLANRQLAAERKAESLKNYLKTCLGGERFKSARCAVSFRKSKHLEIADGANIPAEFVKTVRSVDKAGLTKAIKDGAAIDGVNLVESTSIIVK